MPGPLLRRYQVVALPFLIRRLIRVPFGMLYLVLKQGPRFRAYLPIWGFGVAIWSRQFPKQGDALIA